MQTGRPTKKPENINTLVDEYLIDRKSKMKLPSIDGFARFLNVNRSSVYKWRDEDDSFSDMLDKILNEQQIALLDNGLNNDWNSNIAKLVLAKHGYRDEKKVEIPGSEGFREILRNVNKDG